MSKSRSASTGAGSTFRKGLV